jgi:single-strand DNA-binding protein
VSCFRLLAEHVAASVRKGDPVVVVGKLRTNVWEKDGQTHERLVLEADMVGHDLNRGTSAFRRRPRLSSNDSREADGAPPPDDEVEAAGLSAEERAAQAAQAA